METLVLVVLSLPIFLILIVANAAQRSRERDEDSNGLAVFTWVLLVGLHLMMALGGAAFLAAGSLLQGQTSTETLAGIPLDTAAIASPGLLGWGLLLPALAGIVLLLPAVRRALARIIPIDPANIVHAAALSLSMLVIVNMVATLGIGLGNLVGSATAVPTAAVWAQAGLMIALAFVGVGWPIRRDFTAARQRLGIVAPTFAQLAIGVGLALVLVFFVMVITAVAGALGFGVDADVEDLTEQLLGNLTQSPFGIITLGLAAALGEETLMRGAAQPRFGIILTALLFALLHSNYGITISTSIVFLVGLVLGWVRVRHNTSTAMALHATYNMILGLLAYLSIDILERLGQ